MKMNDGQQAPVRTPQLSGVSNRADFSSGSYGNHSGQNDQNASHKSESTKKKVFRILLWVLIVTLGLSLGGGIYVFQMFGRIGYSAVAVVDPDDYELIDPGSLDSINAESGDTTSSWAEGGHTKVFYDPDFPIKKVDQKDKNVENILVFGVDSRGTDDVRCRADAVMIVSIDNNTKTLKLISLMRDCGVEIEGRSSADKLTHSYAYGGVGLLINTINDNFDLDVQRFVMLDFSSSSALIDLVGGINVDVKPEEVKYANQSINEENTLMETNVPYLTSAGVQNLNGIQAIAWSRIRHADSDFVRTSRQRVIASALIKKLAGLNIAQQLAFVDDSVGMFETNMSKADLIRVGTSAIGLVKNMVEYRIPDDGLFTIQDNPWMMIINWDEQLPRLREYIWGVQ